MLQVVSVSGFSNQPISVQSGVGQSARRGGFVHGTKIATTSGWKLVERIAPGDLVRTLDNGFKEVRRVSTDMISIPADESRADYLPVQVPSRAAYNGRAVWLMPEQGMALDHSKLDPSVHGISVVPARLLSGAARLRSRAPAAAFEVSTLFFDHDEVVFVEGGLQAYCTACRFGGQSASGGPTYDVLGDEDAAEWIDIIAFKGDLSALANPLGALPAPIPQEPIFPIRPALGVRRPGRPGRPEALALFLRSEWQT